MENLLPLGGVLAVLLGVFGVGYMFAPRKRSGSVVAPDLGSILDDIRELDQGRSDEAKRKVEEAGKGDDPFGEITDLFN